jgi:hypothetical protein
LGWQLSGGCCLFVAIQKYRKFAVAEKYCWLVLINQHKQD